MQSSVRKGSEGKYHARGIGTGWFLEVALDRSRGVGGGGGTGPGVNSCFLHLHSSLPCDYSINSTAIITDLDMKPAAHVCGGGGGGGWDGR